MNNYHQLLLEIGADKINHHGRTLLEHLQGTHHLLVEWGNAQDIALAGLFHSIYGTEEFSEKAVPIKERPIVASHIGDKAEELVYLFSVADRRDLFSLNQSESLYINTPSLLPETKQIKLSDEQYSALIEIEVANIVEQAMHQTGVPSTVVDFWNKAFDSKRDFMTDAAANSYTQVLSDYPAI